MFTLSYHKNNFHFDTVSIPSSIRQLAETKPDSEAFVFLSNDGPREAITWRQFHATCVDHAKSLMTLGVQPGDIVAITASNSSRCLYAIFGSIYAGAIPLGLYNTLQDGGDIISIFKKLEKCSTYIVDPTDYWNTLNPLITTHSKDGNVTSAKLPSLKYLLFTSAPENETEILTMENLLTIPPETGMLPVIDPDGMAAMFHTSGTTGIPKIFGQTHRSISCTAQSYSATCFTRGERLYNDGMFLWAGGWPYNVVTGETLISIVIKRQTDPTQTRSLILHGIKQERCTAFRSMQPKLKFLLETQAAAGDDWPVRTIIASGLPVGRHLVDLVKPFCSSFINQYGASEVPVALDNITGQQDDFTDYCCGDPVRGVEVKVVDDEGQTVPVNTRGEIYMKGPGMFDGYFNDPELTKKAITEDGWYKSDDIGYMATDGRVFVQGRKSEAMVCGGSIVLPSTVESILKSCPGVRDVAVVPVPDDVFFQLMCACVIREPGADVTENTVRRVSEGAYTPEAGEVITNRLLKYIVFVDSFPVSETGKVIRKRLTDQAIKLIQG